MFGKFKLSFFILVLFVFVDKILEGSKNEFMVYKWCFLSCVNL
jgi:hypothetical protein